MSLIASRINLFCDGACLKNPGPGGYGAVLIYPNGIIKEIGGYTPDTTNNRMEMMAMWEGLKEISDTSTPVAVFSDSAYTINGLSQWAKQWVRNNWISSTRDPVLNKDLWEPFYSYYLSNFSTRTTFTQVPAHVGIPLNERVDSIASSFAQQKPLELFSGPKSQYPFSLDFDLEAARNSKAQKKKSSSKKAYSYVSLVSRQVQSHQTWDECKSRVDRQPGAKFKKVFSKDEENALMNLWSKL